MVFEDRQQRASRFGMALVITGAVGLALAGCEAGRPAAPAATAPRAAATEAARPVTIVPATRPAVVVAATGVSAVRANDFLNSICVCTHISQHEDDPVKVAECLKYIGFRGIRDDGTTNPKLLQAYVDVYKNSGAKINLLAIGGNVAASLAEYEFLAAAGACMSVEGPNEPNNFWHIDYGGAKRGSDKTKNLSSMPIALFQRDLYAAVKADPKLAGLPVFHSSEAGGSEPDNCGLQYLTIPAGAGCLLPEGTKFADYANPHNYVCDHLKGITKDNIAWNAEDPTLKAGWDGLASEYGHTWWGKGFKGYSNAELEALPRVTTETGWTTGSKDSISEEEQGKVFLNLYLAAYKRNWTYTFIYMLHDSRGQGAWGLVRGDYSYKPSGIYMHNLTTILADGAAAFTPGKVDYSIPAKPVTVHDLLVQKSDGTFELAVWSELAKGSSNVTVNLGASYASVKVYDPTVGTSPVQTLVNVDTVPLTLSDHPCIIELGGPGH